MGIVLDINFIVTLFAQLLVASISAFIGIYIKGWFNMRGHLKAIYMELREAKIFLKDFKFEPNVATRIPSLPTASWEAAKSAGIINPRNPLHIKLRDIYRGFQLINENVQVATTTATLSIRSDWMKIVKGMMELNDRINSWLLPILEETLKELEAKLKLSAKEVAAIEKVEEELRKRKAEYIKRKIIFNQQIQC